MSWLEELCHECYAAHCILTNLGYEPDEVFIGVQPVINGNPPGPHAIVRLSRGDRQFVIHLLPVTAPEAFRFEKAWNAFVAAKPSVPVEELNRIVVSTWIWRQKAQLLWALVNKGFEIKPGKMVN